MTVFASAADGEWLDGSYFVDAPEVWDGDSFDIVPDAEGHGFKIVVKDQAPSGYAGALIVENPNGYQYLVVDVDEITCNGWTVEGLSAGWNTDVKKYVIDLSTMDGAFAGALWMMDPDASYVHIAGMYLVNDPDAVPSEGGNGGGNTNTGVESAVAVAAAAVIGAGALIAISRKK
jgi:hypothetical protein